MFSRDLQNSPSAGIHERLNSLMWIDRCWVAEHFATQLERLKSFRLEWYMLYHNIGTISSRPYYLPWVAFREYGDWCDSLGNVLAILTGVADWLLSKMVELGGQKNVNDFILFQSTPAITGGRCTE